MKARWPVHPLLFAAYPVVQLFAHNIAGLQFSDLLLPLAAALAVAVLATSLCWLPFRNLRKAAVLASLFLWLFFCYEGSHSGLRAVRVGRFHPGSFWLIAAFWLISLGCAVYALRRTRRNLGNLTHILNATGGFLVLTCIGLLVFKLHAAAEIKGHEAGARRTPSQPILQAADALENAPDIYFILLDQYPRSGVLQKGFGYDNSWFLDGLREMGFYVAEHSASNYPRTAMSLGSMLNLEYLDKLLGNVKEDNPELGLAAKLVAHNAVFSFVREHGYRTVYLAPEYGAGNPLDVDVRLISGSAVPEFTRAVMEMTPIQPLLEFFAPRYTIEDLHRQHVLFTLESLRKLPRMGLSPFFVYAHILCPHPPIVFGANGESVLYNLDEIGRETWGMSREARLHYVDQVAYISKEAEETVAEILAHSKRPPVIVLCSDHGSEFEVNWRSAEKSNMQERLANLETFYFPDGGDKLLYPSITNVNVFRVLFNCYFGAHYELLPDKSYFSTDDRPYRFIQVPMDVPYFPQPPSTK